MGLFSWIRQLTGGGGGVGAKIQLPKDFTWEDRFIPVVVTLHGHKSEVRTVESLRFRFSSEESQESSNQSGSTVYQEWDVDELITLQPATSQVVTVQMPLPFDLDALEEAMPVAEEGASRTERLLGGLIRSGMRPPLHIRQYKVVLSARVQGFKVGAGASARIRFGSAFYKGPSTITFGSGN